MCRNIICSLNFSDGGTWRFVDDHEATDHLGHVSRFRVNALSRNNNSDEYEPIVS